MNLELKLNSLVESFNKGDEDAIEQLAAKFIPIINKTSEKIWHSIESQTEFECRCLIRIKRALRTFSSKKGKLTQHVLSVIEEERRDFLKRRSKKFKDIISIDQPLYTDSEGNEVYMEIEDVLADIESHIGLKEKVALLSKGDSRRKTILNAWADGEYNDLELARVLAHSFGGQVNTHRKFIQRFRIECQEKLTHIS